MSEPQPGDLYIYLKTGASYRAVERRRMNGDPFITFMVDDADKPIHYTEVLPEGVGLVWRRSLG